MLKFAKSLFILGDIGYLNLFLHRLVDNIESVFIPDNKIILLGDNFYDNMRISQQGVSSILDVRWEKFIRIFEPIGFNNIYAVMGNHDYEGDPNVQLQSPYIKNNEFYYKLHFCDNTDLFFIDTVQLYENHCYIGKNNMKRILNEDDYSVLKNKQLGWLNSELEKSTAKNKIVFGHYPIISNGAYKNLLNPIKQLLLPIFKKHTVTAYISGHEHNIQYLEENFENYKLRQFIIGSSSQHRINECNQPITSDMYDNKECFFLRICHDNGILVFEFVNDNNQIKYKYII
jgi:hypothetical protein